MMEETLKRPDDRFEIGRQVSFSPHLENTSDAESSPRFAFILHPLVVCGTVWCRASAAQCAAEAPVLPATTGSNGFVVNKSLQI